MIKDLIKIANELDSKGLSKEADALDEIIKEALDADPATEAYMIYGAFTTGMAGPVKLLVSDAEDLKSLANQWQTMREDRWLNKVYWELKHYRRRLVKASHVCDNTVDRIDKLKKRLGADHPVAKDYGRIHNQVHEFWKALGAADHFKPDDIEDIYKLSGLIRGLPDDQLADYQLWSENPAVKEFIIKSDVYPYSDLPEGYNSFAQLVRERLIQIPSDIQKVFSLRGVVTSNLRSAVRELRKSTSWLEEM